MDLIGEKFGAAIGAKRDSNNFFHPLRMGERHERSMSQTSSRKKIQCFNSIGSTFKKLKRAKSLYFIDLRSVMANSDFFFLFISNYSINLWSFDLSTYELKHLDFATEMPFWTVSWMYFTTNSKKPTNPKDDLVGIDIKKLISNVIM